MSLADKVLRGSAVLLAIRSLQRGLGLISTLILARLLTPADFGIVAIAMLVVYFADTMADSGTPQYLAQTDTVNDPIVNSAWTLDILTKTLASVLILLCLPLFALYWPDPHVNLAIMALAPSIALRALANPQLHVDVRNLVYSNVFFVQSWQKAISFTTVILIAFVWRSYWAIIVGHYAGTVATIILSWLRCHYPARLDTSNFRAQWAFSKWMLSRSFLGYLRGNIDALLISRLHPGAVFGMYTVTRELTVMPANDIIGPVTRPLLSSFSRVRDDRQAFARQLETALLVISLLVSPLCIFIFYNSESIIHVLLGDQWHGAATMMIAMVPMLFSFSVASITNNLILSLGRVKTLFWYDAVSLCILASVIFLFRHTDISQLILARSLTGLVVTVSVTAWVAKSMGVQPARLLILLLIPILIAIIASLPMPASGESGFLSLVLAGLVFFSVYTALTLLTIYRLKGRNASWQFLHRLTTQGYDKLVSIVSGRIKRKQHD